MCTEWSNKMIAVISGMRNFTIQVTGLMDKINVLVLGLLRESSFANLFWTLVLTGSIGMAIPVIFLSYTSNFFKELISR
jgi:uncharacterized membrane protein